MKIIKKIFHWYFEKCRQSDIGFREKERSNPKIWHKDYIVLNFINQNILRVLDRYNLHHSKILDLGCSHKPYQSLFSAEEYFGVDFQEGKQVDLVHDLNEELNLDRKFDLVVSFDTFEHILDTQMIIKTLHDHLLPGGYAIISTPFLFGVHDAPYDFHRFTEYFYANFPHANLQTVSIQRSNSYLSSLIIHLNYFIYRLPIPYVLKFPLYFPVNIVAILEDKLANKIAKLNVTWLSEFIWSGPQEYFVILKKDD